MCNMVGVQWFSESGNVADGCEEQGEFVNFIFGFAEKAEMCKSVVENGNVVIEFNEGGQFVGEGNSESCEIGRCEHEGVTV